MCELLDGKKLDTELIGVDTRACSFS